MHDSSREKYLNQSYYLKPLFSSLNTKFSYALTAISFKVHFALSVAKAAASAAFSYYALSIAALSTAAVFA